MAEGVPLLPRSQRARLRVPADVRSTSLKRNVAWWRYYLLEDVLVVGVWLDQLVDEAISAAYAMLTSTDDLSELDAMVSALETFHNTLFVVYGDQMDGLASEKVLALVDSLIFRASDPRRCLDLTIAALEDYLLAR